MNNQEQATADNIAPEGLRACPLCGQKAELSASRLRDAFWANCTHCGLEHTTFDTEAEAIDAWNTRIAHEAPQPGERENVVEQLIEEIVALPGMAEGPTPLKVHELRKLLQTALAKPVDAPADVVEEEVRRLVNCAVKGDNPEVITRAILAALRTQSAVSDAGDHAEPYAWLVSHPQHGSDIERQRLTDADKKSGWTEAPLFAAQAITAQAAEIAALTAEIDRLKKQAGDD